MQRSTVQILTTHVGSLPRDPAALELVQARNAGDDLDAGNELETLHRVVDDVVRRQVEAGVSVVNDGEQSKFAYYSYYRDRLTGFEAVLDAPPFNPILGAEAMDYPDYYARWPQQDGAAQIRQDVCTGPVAYRDIDALQRDIDNLKAAGTASGARDLFMTAISPGMMRRTPNDFYADADAYDHALCDAIRCEYEAITSAGIVLQIDAPDLGIGPRLQAMTVEEHRQQVVRNIALINYATRGLPPELMRVHVCCGADHAPHDRDPALINIVDLLLTLEPAGLTVVGANARHQHEWKTWKHVKLPKGKVLIPGVIDSTSNIIEHPEVVADRIVQYAHVVGRENVIAGTDCGFATVAGNTQVDPAIAWAKLRSLVEGARIATDALWGRTSAG